MLVAGTGRGKAARGPGTPPGFLPPVPLRFPGTPGPGKAPRDPRRRLRGPPRVPRPPGLVEQVGPHPRRPEGIGLLEEARPHGTRVGPPRPDPGQEPPGEIPEPQAPESLGLDVQASFPGLTPRGEEKGEERPVQRQDGPGQDEGRRSRPSPARPRGESPEHGDLRLIGGQGPGGRAQEGVPRAGKEPTPDLALFENRREQRPLEELRRVETQGPGQGREAREGRESVAGLQVPQDRRGQRPAASPPGPSADLLAGQSQGLPPGTEEPPEEPGTGLGGVHEASLLVPLGAGSGAWRSVSVYGETGVGAPGKRCPVPAHGREGRTNTGPLSRSDASPASLERDGRPR